jgi:hypothetical protein
VPRRRSLLPIALLAAVLSSFSAAPFDAAGAARLSEAALGGQAMTYARGLTTEIGPRLSGTVAYQRAAEWAVERFRAAGLAAGLEPFSMPRAWNRGTGAIARVLSPVDQRLTVESIGWAPPTDGAVEAELIVGGENLASSPDRVRGRIVLADGALRRRADAALRDAGALAILFADDDSANRLSARMRAFGGTLTALPSALVARDDAALLRRLASRGPVRLSLSLPNVVSAEPVALPNVIAELRGRERPDEWVLVGAHLDSWDFAVGAQDNAAGVAMVLEAARAIASLGIAPRRTIRFALWGGEEQGLLGSSAYAARHEAELDRLAAVLNADGGTGRIIGWTTPGRDDVEARVRDLARAFLARIGSDRVDAGMQYAFDSDGGAFVREGVPVLDLNVDDAEYEEIHHKRTDTLDRVDARNLAVGAATVAVTAFAIADLPDRLAPRGPRREPR